MRRRSGILLSMLVLGVAGCELLGQRQRSEHFRNATISEQDVTASVEQTLANLKLVLQDRGMTHARPQTDSESARVFASKDGVEYVFDLHRSGDRGCRVRLEINRSGQQNDATALLRQLQLMSG